MAATETLSHPESACNSGGISQPSPTVSKIVPRHGVITLSGYGISVRVDRGHLVLEDGIGNERRRARLARVGHGLSRLVVIGADGQVSLSALRWLADQNASFVMLERDGSVLATTGPVRSSDARLRRAQALAMDSGVGLLIARELISRKLVGQEQVAKFTLNATSAAQEVSRFCSEIPNADTIPALRLLEARAAGAYWSAWREIPISFPSNDLPRIPDHWRVFGTRISPLTGSPRLAANPPNAILNYLYALLESETRLAAAAVGLDTGLGVIHVDQQSRDSLVFDLMEPVRPQVDAYVASWLIREPLKRAWFFEQRDGNCRLMGSLASRLSETAPTWGRAVSPLAEWMAHVLWRSTQRIPSAKTGPPTPLTQRRRTEGRGRVFSAHYSHAPTPAAICRMCGNPVKTGKHCSACSVITARERMIQVAQKGREARRAPEVLKRMAEKQSDHAVAISWWTPESLPSWLTEEFYVQNIGPKLKSLRVASLARNLGLSKPYAALLRSGKKRPHPRHWEALAKLVNLVYSSHD